MYLNFCCTSQFVSKSRQVHSVVVPDLLAGLDHLYSWLPVFLDAALPVDFHRTRELFGKSQPRFKVLDCIVLLATKYECLFWAHPARDIPWLMWRGHAQQCSAGQPQPQPVSLYDQPPAVEREQHASFASSTFCTTEFLLILQ